MLAAFRANGQELFPLPCEVRRSGFPCVRTFSGAVFRDARCLSDLNWANLEGFVVRYGYGTRVKIKFPSYLALHRAPGARSLLGDFSRSCTLGNTDNAQSRSGREAKLEGSSTLCTWESSEARGNVGRKAKNQAPLKKNKADGRMQVAEHMEMLMEVYDSMARKARVSAIKHKARSGTS